jgi:hypothetical protein
MQTETNGEAKFPFDELPPGTYTLTANAAGPEAERIVFAMNMVFALHPPRMNSLEVNLESDFRAPYGCQSRTRGTQLAERQICPDRIAGGEERDAA